MKKKKIKSCILYLNTVDSFIVKILTTASYYCYYRIYLFSNNSNNNYVFLALLIRGWSNNYFALALNLGSFYKQILTKS